MSAKTVTYSSVRDAVLRRRGITPADATAAQQADAADYITSAYKYCLESYQWAEAIKTATVDCANGLVAWADVEDASWWEFFSEDPRPYTSQGTSAAYAIEVRRSGNDGLWLKTELETVFVRYIAAAPALNDWANDPDLEATPTDWASDPVYLGSWDTFNAGTAIAIDDIALFPDGFYYKALNSGVWNALSRLVTISTNWVQLSGYQAGKIYLVNSAYYRCIVSTGVAPPSDNFDLLGDEIPSLLAILAEPTQWIALADWFDTIQERNQAANLRKQGEDALNKLFTRSAAS